ncbi:MAG: GPR endopeptidase [Hespellia sp.]|nr:GPR endopeptidase [Hespellia sp.]
MISKQNVRTDLALEEKEKFDSDQVEVKGVILEEDYDEKSEIRITRVEIQTEKGAKSMGKPVGIYLTLEAANLPEPDEDYHREISIRIAKCLDELVEHIRQKEKKEDISVLIVGLGNRQVTPDALGPFVIDNLAVNRHIIREYGKYAMNLSSANSISALVPGVMGQTGMETLEIVRGVVEETHPDAVIAIDALAARNSRRLNRTIQITDTGISPGSGVGNHRNGLNIESLGIPVIAIGIPTVVDAVTIVNDTMENLVHALEASKTLRNMGSILKSYTETEKHDLIRELIAPHLNGMYVTPKDIDETMKQVSYTLSESLNMVFTNENRT